MGLGIRSALSRVSTALREVRAAARSSMGITDLRRWRATGRTEPAWDERNHFVGGLIERASSVLDIGCGAQTLSRYLPDECTYQPCDIIEHQAGVWVWDFNKSAFPKSDAFFDFVVCSGVMEYAKDPRSFLHTVSGLGDQLILSYAPTDTVPSKFDRRSAGWVNDLTRHEVQELFAEAGLHWDLVTEWSEQDIYRLRRDM